jgi:hypothetical protein
MTTLENDAAANASHATRIPAQRLFMNIDEWTPSTAQMAQGKQSKHDLVDGVEHVRTEVTACCKLPPV